MAASDVYKRQGFEVTGAEVACKVPAARPLEALQRAHARISPIEDI